MKLFFATTTLAMALLITSGSIWAQSSPSAGSTQGHTYTNESFKLTWEFPPDWVVVNNSDNGANFGSQALLRLQPKGPQSVEYLQLGFSDQIQYQETIKEQIEKLGWEAVQGQGYYALGGGVPAYRYDFQSKQTPTQYLSILAGLWHNQVLVIATVAESTDRTKELINAALKMKIRPDWPPDAQADVTPLTQPGAVPLRVRISSGVSQGLCWHKVPPIYPIEARKAHIQGAVIMQARIDREGTIKNLYVKEGNSMLVAAALDAVSRWQYKPYLLNGLPVEVDTQIVVNFVLQ